MSVARWMTAAALVLAAVPAGTPAWAGSAAAQVAPGTATRPILFPAEAAPFVPENYLGWSGLYTAPVADPWRPGPILTRRPDFVVRADASRAEASRTEASRAEASRAEAFGAEAFGSVQDAVNAAFAAGGTARRYIAIFPGTYRGTVFIPAGSPPLTLFGVGRPGDVRLEFTVDATITPAAWAALVNAGGRYAEGDPAWEMFQSCATRVAATAGLCATVVWAQSTDLQLKGLTITNTLLDTVDRGTHQALALRTDADRTQLEDMRLIGRQDTFLANANDAARIARVSVRDSYIEGDTDFVFGRASAVFTHCHFYLVSTRKSSGGVIFAPNTAPAYPYGFLVTRSLITADDGYRAAPTGHLGRSWDQGAGATGYLPGSTPNGQLVIRDSMLGEGLDTATPWAPAATTARPFAARLDAGRDLDDVNFNRLWEYANRGPAAA